MFNQEKHLRVGRVPVAALLLACVIASYGCEKTSHENIDKWMNTTKGPGKLEKAFKDTGLDADMRAHAGQNLTKINKTRDMIALAEALEDADRQVVLAQLGPRLWEDARIEGEMAVPNPPQIAAKDVLFQLRGMADDANRKVIDEYLLEWFTGGYYTGRSKTGRYTGTVVLRAIGPAGGQSIIDAANTVIAAPKDAKGARPTIQKELLMGLAASGSPDAVGLILSVMKQTKRDKDLPKKGIDALYRAYVDPQELFEKADGKVALGPHVVRLTELAKDESLGPGIANDTVDLLGAAGFPECLEPLVGMVSYNYGDPALRFAAANAAIRCGEVKSVVPVAEALPKNVERHKSMGGAIWDPIVALDAKDEVAAKARTLLASDSWIARLTGVEVLGRLKIKQTAAEDAELIRALTKDKTTLVGWWGDQSDLPKKERKPVPKLGERAGEVAKQLDLLAKGT
jgi:hypothetical protein